MYVLADGLCRKVEMKNKVKICILNGSFSVRPNTDWQKKRYNQNQSYFIQAVI